MNYKDRIEMLEDYKTKLQNLETLELYTDIVPVLEQLKEKYEDLSKTEKIVTYYQREQWEEACTYIDNLIDLVEDIPLTNSFPLTYFTKNTINVRSKRITVINEIYGMFKTIAECVSDIEKMNECLSDDLARVQTNAENEVMLTDAHDNAVNIIDELDSMNAEILEKYKEMLNALENVYNIKC